MLGIAGFLSIATEWWAWEVVGIASAYIGKFSIITRLGWLKQADSTGTANLGANSVLGTSASLLYQLPFGLSVATAVRV